MASFSATPRPGAEGNPKSGDHDQIEHHNMALPVTAEEIAKILQQSSLPELFRHMQEHLLQLKKKNKELEEQIKVKHVTVCSTIVTPYKDTLIKGRGKKSMVLKIGLRRQGNTQEIDMRRNNRRRHL